MRFAITRHFELNTRNSNSILLTRHYQIHRAWSLSRYDVTLLVSLGHIFAPVRTLCHCRSDHFLMDPTTQNILRECADHFIQTADLIACSSPSASTATASTAAPAIAASISTTPSSFQSNSAPSPVSTARAEHACLFGYQPPAGNPRSQPNNGRPLRTNPANLSYNRGQMWTRTFVCLASSSSSQLPTPAERVTLALNNLGEKDRISRK